MVAPATPHGNGASRWQRNEQVHTLPDRRLSEDDGSVDRFARRLSGVVPATQVIRIVQPAEDLVQVTLRRHANVKKESETDQIGDEEQ